MPVNTVNILNRLSKLIDTNQIDSQSYQVKQQTKSKIKQQLYTFSQFMSQQIIKLSVYYQTKLQYQAGDYEEEISVLKQQIERQYRVIELMKQELEELVILVNERGKSEREVGNRGQQRNIGARQIKDNNENNIDDTQNQNRIKKYQQNPCPTNPNQPTPQLTNIPSRPTISGLQIITEEQTERTLMSNCEEEQGQADCFVYEGQKEHKAGLFEFQGGQEEQQRQGQDAKCDKEGFMLIEDESQEIQGLWAKGDDQSQLLPAQGNHQTLLEHHIQYSYYNNNLIQPQPQLQAQQGQPTLPSFKQPTWTQPRPQPLIYFISSNKKPSTKKQQSSSDPLQKQFIEESYHTHQNQSSQDQQDQQTYECNRIIHKDLSQHLSINNPTSHQPQHLSINNPTHQPKFHQQPKTSNVMDFLEQIALGDLNPKPIKPINISKSLNPMKNLPTQHKKCSKVFTHPYQRSIPRSSSRSKSKQSHPSTHPKHQTQQFDQSQHYDSSSRISRIRYTTDNFYSLADGQSISQKDKFFLDLLERQHLDMRSLQATFGKKDQNPLQQVVMSCTNRVKDHHDGLTQKPTTQSRKSSLKQIAIKQANPQKKPHNNNKQNIPHRKSSDTTCHKPTMLKKPSSSKYLPSKHPLNLAISPEQSIHNLLQSHLQSHNKFLVGQKKQQLKYDGDRVTMNNCSQPVRHGHGILFYSNGLIYEGQFQNNKRQGYGLLKFNHVQLYTGDWFNDELHGTGKIRNCAIINKKKKQLTSETHHSPNITNQAFYQSMFLKWISYCGQFRHNRFDGQGTLYLQGGEKFVGFFKNGTAQGQGALYRKNGQVQNGRWKNNVLVQRLENSWQ